MEEKMEDLLCKIYVLAELDRFQLADFIGNQLNFDVDGKFVHTSEFEIEIRENEDFDPRRVQDEDFLFYPIYLEIEPKDNIGSSGYIHSIGKLLNILREKGFKAVAACDFEDLLPLAVSNA
jgi:hypothetical protein